MEEEEFSSSPTAISTGELVALSVDGGSPLSAFTLKGGGGGGCCKMATYAAQHFISCNKGPPVSRKRDGWVCLKER